jgi:hypothetical protein
MWTNVSEVCVPSSLISSMAKYASVGIPRVGSLLAELMWTITKIGFGM